MSEVKERVFGVQATFNLGNYQSLKVTRSVTMDFEPDEDSVRKSFSEGLKEDARYYAKELFKEKLGLEISREIEL